MQREYIHLTSTKKQEFIDITTRVRAIAGKYKEALLVALFAKGATAAIMIQENWDPNIKRDIISCLDRIIPEGIWLHDRVDNNAAAHIKSGIVGPSQSIPMADGELLLGQWQNIFFCEFDGPRREREVILTFG